MNPLAVNNLFTLHIFGLSIPISDSIVMMWVVMALLIIAALLFTRRLETVPKGRQNVAEVFVDFVNRLMKSNLGEHGKGLAPYFGTLLLFLFFANMVEVFNIFPSGEQLWAMTGWEFFRNFRFSLVPPTKDLNVTGAFALMNICLIPILAVRYKGPVGFLKSFLKPSPVMLPFHVLDYATRTLSLSLRLFGNILAGYIIIDMLYRGALYVKPLIPLASLFFDLFDAGLQAYIFVFLSSLYISEAIE